MEALPAAKELENGIYGQMPIQIGCCNGHNKKLNAVEYHRDSEVDIAVDDLILILGKQQDIEEDHTYNTSRMEARGIQVRDCPSKRHQSGHGAGGSEGP